SEWRELREWKRHAAQKRPASERERVKPSVALAKPKPKRISRAMIERFLHDCGLELEVAPLNSQANGLPKYLIRDPEDGLYLGRGADNLKGVIALLRKHVEIA